jgi:hypothetical protein
MGIYIYIIDMYIYMYTYIIYTHICIYSNYLGEQLGLFMGITMDFQPP